MKKKIIKKSIVYLTSVKTLRIYKFNKSKNYYCSFYVGYNFSKSGNIERTLKTSNIHKARENAFILYRNWWLTHQIKKENKEKNFDKDIAQEFFRHRYQKYKNRQTNTAEREKQKYENYLKKYFENVDYNNIEEVNLVIEEILNNLQHEKKSSNTMIKYISLISMMFRRGLSNGVISKLPDFPTVKRVSQTRPSYFNEELNRISKKLEDEYKRTEDKFYVETKDYINLLRSGGFRPGIEPLKIKRFQYRFIVDKEDPSQPILVFTLFGTKTKPKHQLTCNPYFTKNIFIPEILKRNPDSKPDDYLLFPNHSDRLKLYQKMSKLFIRISTELGLYVRDNQTRPLYSIRHTFAKNRYNQNASLEVVARQMNTSQKMLQVHYLDEDDKMITDEHKRLFPDWYLKKKTKEN